MIGGLMILIALLMLALVFIPGARAAINPLYIGAWIVLVVLLCVTGVMVLVNADG
jgi:hypothetical protein